MELKISKTKQEVAENFTDFLVHLMHDRSPLHVALSGGSTPKIVFDELAARHISEHIWENIHFYWGDERCVSPEDDDSNYKMTLTHLLSKIKIPERNIHRIKGENEPYEEAERYAEVLKKEVPSVEDVPRFDLIILGMGDDGHTASIFPEDIDLWYVQSPCAVAEHPDSGQQRITITGKVINKAETVAFLVTGESKAQKVGEIIDRKEGYEKYPASLVAPVSENLFWFLDSAAAKHLTSG
ncbi:6-phosphogluconolactonase [Pareuzebyella sediminis]|uniref:6-phosphogluconolactonase n=1 Tax=Pareuzebyella sediminis TaxID=2607998 RepID=UPI0011ED4998|nr:6-phosphogluconolactonase [Pareuzebyella sediminis]